MTSPRWDEAKAERQRIRRSQMSDEQKELAKKKQRARRKPKTPEQKYNRQHRRRVKLTSNHPSMFARLGKVVYTDLYKKFFKAQQGKCGICLKPVEEEKRKLALDHDHDILVVRGLLCYSCNHKLGWFEKYYDEICDYMEWE